MEDSPNHTIRDVDRIVLEGMVFSGNHGVSEGERARAQRFTVDVEVEADLSRAARSDRLADTVDYRRLHAIAKEVIEGESALLVEALAGWIASEALKVPGIRAVTVRVAKQPKSMQPIDAAAIVLRRAKR